MEYHLTRKTVHNIFVYRSKRLAVLIENVGIHEKCLDKLTIMLVKFVKDMKKSKTAKYCGRWKGVEKSLNHCERRVIWLVSQNMTV